MPSKCEDKGDGCSWRSSCEVEVLSWRREIWLPTRRECQIRDGQPDEWVQSIRGATSPNLLAHRMNLSEHARFRVLGDEGGRRRGKGGCTLGLGETEGKR